MRKAWFKNSSGNNSIVTSSCKEISDSRNVGKYPHHRSRNADCSCSRTDSRLILFLAAFLLLAVASDVAYSYIEVSGSISSNTIWGPTGSDPPGQDDTYYVTDNVNVNANITLTIQAGTTVKFNSGTQMVVYGTLVVDGDDGSMVTFTSKNDDYYGDTISGSSESPSAGDWIGIIVEETGEGDFDYCHILYGGNIEYGGIRVANLYFKKSSSGHFENSICEKSGNFGIRIWECSPVFRYSIIANNNDDGVFIEEVVAETANPNFGTSSYPGNNTFEGNGGYDLNNSTENTIAFVGNTYDTIYGPTMVVLSSFAAMAEDGKVILVWRTECEVDNVGFGIYRSDIRDGSYILIAFVSSAQDSETSNDYQIVDKQVRTGQTYYYYLEDIDLSGKRTKSDVLRVALPEVALPAQTRSEILPERNSLLANYPNPFNPDTWIPYSLAEPADVIIRMYDIRGHLIRTLYLGHQPAGFYVSKDKAAYWDGRDDTGEQVGSGVYFYTIQTDEFTATRKMLLCR